MLHLQLLSNFAHRAISADRSQTRLAAPLAIPTVLAALVGLASLAGCASPRTASTPTPDKPLVWPAPPDPPRFSYVRSITRPADLGIKTSAFKRFGQWITGS